MRKELAILALALAACSGEEAERETPRRTTRAHSVQPAEPDSEMVFSVQDVRRGEVSDLARELFGVAIEWDVMDFDEEDYSLEGTDILAGSKVLDVIGVPPVQQMMEVCADTPQSLEQGMERLKIITPYWVALALNDGAIYVRGGKVRDGFRCTNNAQADFADEHMRRHLDDYERPAACSKGLGKRGCKTALQEMYQRRMVDRFSGHYLCADCHTFVTQLYECAFGRISPFTTDPTSAPVIAASPGAIRGEKVDPRTGGQILLFHGWRDRRGMRHWGRASQPDMGTCWSVVEEQLDGELQFGDIIHFPGHFVMYTGGIGLDYELVEMGTYAFTDTEIVEADITADFNGERMSRVRAIIDATDALSGHYVRRGCAIRRVSKRPSRFNYKSVSYRGE
ncbi:hypothetical protein KY362_01240 [Candidatus Woesearchaeota archaeon]|nr:hypothetical protein [Candidatus Woesearchaeota archaeon]